jgi:hypothetical protein
MTIERAIEILNFSKFKTPSYYAKMAKLRTKTLSIGSPLKYKVACKVLIDAE